MKFELPRATCNRKSAKRAFLFLVVTASVIGTLARAHYRLLSDEVVSSNCPDGGQTVTFAQIGNHGRLGNQLFQIAATIGIAEVSGAKWAFPVSISTTAAGRLFELRGKKDLSSNYTELLEGSQLFHQIKLPDSECLVSLHGYYQSRKYFELSHESLKQHLKLPVDKVQYVRQQIDTLGSDGTVAFHIRRGDYTMPPFNELYNLLTPDYYIRAFSKFENVARVIIATNDRQWCEENLEGKLAVPVIYSPFDDEILDFILLHLSKNIVIANSSFSWWAAFLRHIHRLPYRIVAPSSWYKTDGDLAHLNGNDFVLHSWIRLPND